MANSKTVKCLICGYEAYFLVPHLRRKHKMSGEEYKSQYPGALLRYPKSASQETKPRKTYMHFGIEVDELGEPVNPADKYELMRRVGTSKSKLRFLKGGK